jgi:hypothetical protein
MIGNRPGEEYAFARRTTGARSLRGSCQRMLNLGSEPLRTFRGLAVTSKTGVRRYLSHEGEDQTASRNGCSTNVRNKGGGTLTREEP